MADIDLAEIDRSRSTNLPAACVSVVRSTAPRCGSSRCGSTPGRSRRRSRPARPGDPGHAHRGSPTDTTGSGGRSGRPVRRPTSCGIAPAMSVTSTTPAGCGSRADSCTSSSRPTVRSRSVPIERSVERSLGARACRRGRRRSGGRQQVVVVIEDESAADGPAGDDLVAGVRAAVDTPVAAVLSVRQLPVDIRHNAKIDRAAVAAWADGVARPVASPPPADEDPGHRRIEPDRGGRRTSARRSRATTSSACSAASSPRSTASDTCAQQLGDVRDRDAVLTAAAAGATASSTSRRRSAWSAPGRSTERERRRHGQRARRGTAVGVERVVHVSSPSVAHGGEPIVGGLRGSTGPRSVARLVPRVEGDGRDRRARRGVRHLGVVAIRPHLVWGPGDTQLVGRIVQRAAAGRLALVGDGRALVDTTYIDNAVGALVAALDAVQSERPCVPDVPTSCRTVSHA